MVLFTKLCKDFVSPAEGFFENIVNPKNKENKKKFMTETEKDFFIELSCMVSK